jgi:hypothetical protein
MAFKNMSEGWKEFVWNLDTSRANRIDRSCYACTPKPSARLVQESTKAGGGAEAVDVLDEEVIDNHAGAITGRDRVKLETVAETIGENLLRIRARVSTTTVRSPNGRAGVSM